jgi:DNA-binding winged helix-turn-helix (wHTH) protein
MTRKSHMRHGKPATPEIELDLGRYELRREGRRVKLEKKPMELLILLVGRRDQMVSREDIVAKLWRSHLFIDTEPNINNIVRKIRAALGDNSAKPRFLETVVGKGYRFVGPIRVVDARHPESDFGQASTRVAGLEKGSAWRERSSLAILPLVLAGGATDDGGLSLGFADALVSRLGNLQGVDVLPTSAVLNLPAEGTASEIASLLGVRFVLCGGIQMSKGQQRLSLEMFDSQLQSVCFTKRCDVDLGRLPDLEDEVARGIAGALNRPLTPAVSLRHPRYSNDPFAYEEFMRGYGLSAAGDPTLLDEAARHLTGAVARDPSFFFFGPCDAFICLCDAQLRV